jgi:DNA-binding transcriptional ArsR family regulator
MHVLMRDALNSELCSRYLKALADPERLRIVQCLRSGPRTVGDISDEVNSVIANVSHHLKQLRRAGVVRGKRQGRNVTYSICPNLTEQPKDPSTPQNPLNVLNFGCCRIELGKN